MSFGFPGRVKTIADALRNAVAKRVVMFAAASNDGGNESEAWPARDPDVISIYAADGYGNGYGRNPTPPDHGEAFSILGVEVRGHRPQQTDQVPSTGTSVATVIAAGVASSVVAYMRAAKAAWVQQHPEEPRDKGPIESEYDDLLEDLTTHGAMRKVFFLMTAAKTRQDYYYITPWRLLNEKSKDRTAYTVEKILSAIREVRR
jgi:hypothetical protein